MRARGRPPHPDILTPREWEVLGFLREGLSNPEIAQRLDISRDGVKYHVSEILTKLGVATRVEAAAWSPRERPWWAGTWSLAQRPRWATAFAPFVWLRRLGGGQVASAAAGTLVLAVLAGLALIALLLVRGGDGDGGRADGPAVGSGEPPVLSVPARPEQNVLYVVDEDGSGLRELHVSDSLSNVQWSQGGNEVAFVAEDEGELHLLAMSADGGQQRLLRRIADPTSSIEFLWAPRGDRIALLVESAGELLDIEGTQLGSFEAGRLVEWSPDGTRLLVLADDRPDLATEQAHDLAVIDAATQERTVIAQTDTQWPRIAAWSPDGTAVAYAAYPEDTSCESENGPYDGQSLRVVDVASGAAREAYGPMCGAGIAGYAWSPDGTRIAFGAPGVPGLDGELERGSYIIDITTGELTQLTSGTIDFDVEWLPDGETLAVKRANCWQCDGSQWWALVTADGQELAEWSGSYPGLGVAPDASRVAVGTAEGDLIVAGADGVASDAFYSAPPFQFRDVAWSPTGERIAFVRWQGFKSNVFFASPGEGRVDPQVLPQGAAMVTYSDDLEQVAYVATADNLTLVARDLYVAPAERPDDATLIAENVWLGPLPIAWSPDGSRIAFPRETEYPAGEYVVANADGSGETVILDDPDMLNAKFTFTWLPDGQRLLFSALSSEDGEPFVIDAATGARTPADVPIGTWSPDGTQVAYMSERDLIVSDASGANARTILTLDGQLGFSTGEFSWSPDGAQLAILALDFNSGGGSLWLIDADGGGAEQVASARPRPPQFEGEFVPTLRPYQPSMLRPRWAPDGSSIAFPFATDEGTGVYLFDLASQQVEPLSLGRYPHVPLGWTADGRLAFVSQYIGP